MIRKVTIALLSCLLWTGALSAQGLPPGYTGVHFEMEGNDTIDVFEMVPIYIFNGADLKGYERLVYNLKKVYPIAKEANRLFQETEEKLEGINSKRVRSEYIKDLEVQLKKQYTPILKNMSYSQGKLLIKLIDRETDHTTYELVKDLRGSFSAFLWQGVARLFTANLKDTYDAKGEDIKIEYLIMLYEAGLL